VTQNKVIAKPCDWTASGLHDLGSVLSECWSLAYSRSMAKCEAAWSLRYNAGAKCWVLSKQ